MEELRWIARDDLADDLERPLLVVAFRGLFDASGSATAAVEWMAGRIDHTRIGDVDPETFFDFTQERPVVNFDERDTRVLTWPRNEVLLARTPEGQRDLLMVSGVEPHLRWRTFANALSEVATITGVATVVTLGAILGMTPHTRPLSVTGSSTNAQLADRLGLDRPSYQGPTGLVGVLHDTLDRAGTPVISLRVSVPHYVPDTPNPKATRALLRWFEQVSGVSTSYADLDGPAADWQRQVDAAVAGDQDLLQYVKRLETQADQTEELIPSGDDLAAELEAFLREQADGPDNDPPG
jgi:proteasome assembly chaperone (PAC2) family protein